jgi:hypothetical protein
MHRNNIEVNRGPLTYPRASRVKRTAISINTAENLEASSSQMWQNLCLLVLRIERGFSLVVETAVSVGNSKVFQHCVWHRIEIIELCN